jgi:tetratricopeptide (TPR) repeat protein
MQHLLTTTRLSAVALAAALAAGGTASAQPAKKPDQGAAKKGAPSAEELAKAKEHFARGKKLFDKKDFKGAVLEFKESYRLTRNPLLLYNIGFTLDQLGDKPMAVFYYQKYLQGAPEADANRAAAEGRVQVLELEIEEAKVMGGTDAGGEGKPVEKPEPEKAAAPVVDRFQHNVIDEAPPGRPIDVGAFIPPSKKWQVTLFYRAAGEGKFTPLAMRPRYNELIGRIPATKTVGASVQYYIEVKDANGKLIDRSGKQTSTHLVFLDKSAKARYYADLGDERADPIASEEAVASGGGMLASEQSPRGTGWMDAGSSKFSKLKWGTTVAAGGLVALATTFYLLSSKAASDLEAEAVASGNPAECPGVPPCRSFSDEQQGLEGRGQRFETFANVSLGIGAAAAIGAGFLWYLDIRDSRRRRRAREGAAPNDEPNLSAAPILGQDFVGGTAAWRF